MAKEQKLTIQPSLILSSPVHISYSSDRSKLDKHFNAKNVKRFSSLYELAQTEPSSALNAIISFAQEHPNVPMVYNLLAFCYIQLKDIASADKAIEEAFLRFPDYLFAKINYADLLLRKKKWRQVPEVFDHTLDLSLLCPDRKSFHYSEVRGFMTAIGYYYHEKGTRKLALDAFRIAVQADPTHPSVLALEKALFYNPLLRFIKSMFRKTRLNNQ